MLHCVSPPGTAEQASAAIPWPEGGTRYLDEAGDTGDGAAHEEDLDGCKQKCQHVQLLASQLHLRTSRRYTLDTRQHPKTGGAGHCNTWEGACPRPCHAQQHSSPR